MVALIIRIAPWFLQKWPQVVRLVQNAAWFVLSYALVLGGLFVLYLALHAGK